MLGGSTSCTVRPLAVAQRNSYAVMPLCMIFFDGSAAPKGIVYSSLPCPGLPELMTTASGAS